MNKLKERLKYAVKVVVLHLINFAFFVEKGFLSLRRKWKDRNKNKAPKAEAPKPHQKIPARYFDIHKRKHANLDWSTKQQASRVEGAPKLHP